MIIAFEAYLSAQINELVHLFPGGQNVSTPSKQPQQSKESEEKCEKSAERHWLGLLQGAY